MYRQSVIANEISLVGTSLKNCKSRQVCCDTRAHIGMGLYSARVIKTKWIHDFVAHIKAPGARNETAAPSPEPSYNLHLFSYNS